MDNQKIQEAADKVAAENDADVLLFNAAMQGGIDKKLRALIAGRTARKQKVIIILVTPGGLADPAYRAARALQLSYGNVAACVAGWCKSAGTLLAIGAHQLIIGPDGELGPLDVQIVKKDAIGDRDSGLIMNSALDSLRTEAFGFFEQYMIGIIARSQNAVTFRTAAEIAADLTIGMMAPVFDKIDPARLGADARAMNIGMEYAKRLNLLSGNLRSGETLNMILNGYPSHSFVIDLLEASMLFTRVSPLNGSLETLVGLLGNRALMPGDEPDIGYLNGDEGAASGGGEADGQPEAQPPEPTEGGGDVPDGLEPPEAPQDV